jgi:hypothetical protein
MVLQMLAEGADFKNTLNSLPMAMEHAQAATNQLKDHLELPEEQRATTGPSGYAETLANREIAVVGDWIKTLRIDVSADTESETVDRLCKEINDRMMNLYFADTKTTQNIKENLP